MTAKGLDLDARMRDSAQEPITIGGRTFHAGRQDWEAIQDLRKAGRQASRADARRTRTEKQATELEEQAGQLDGDEADAKYAEADRLYEQADEQFRQTLMATCATVARQLVDDKGERPAPEFIFEKVDFRAGLTDLIGHLVGEVDDEDGADPTS